MAREHPNRLSPGRAGRGTGMLLLLIRARTHPAQDSRLWPDTETYFWTFSNKGARNPAPTLPPSHPKCITGIVATQQLQSLQVPLTGFCFESRVKPLGCDVTAHLKARKAELLPRVPRVHRCLPSLSPSHSSRANSPRGLSRSGAVNAALTWRRQVSRVATGEPGGDRCFPPRRQEGEPNSLEKDGTGRCGPGDRGPKANRH